ncbi:hypothetical protein FHX08_003741 [Rhizobium sp. BK529]|nr:hypothetical protein [Rhizobium sp. BK529]
MANTGRDFAIVEAGRIQPVVIAASLVVIGQRTARGVFDDADIAEAAQKVRIGLLGVDLNLSVADILDARDRGDETGKETGARRLTNSA